jgi:PTH1 family peptidyl-tRNA hydrolase
MPLIVGLGNPGAEYAGTPHNVGFEVLVSLSKRAGVFFKRSPVAQSQETRLPGTAPAAILFKPLAFMNLSGACVAAALSFYRLTPSDLLVICDDVNLPLGHLRLRMEGGSGGQKGLQSIIATLGTEEFVRLRIGVGGGEPGADVARHVLSRFPSGSQKLVSQTIELAADAILCFLANGLDAAMNMYNTKKEKNNSPSGENRLPDTTSPQGDF